ncbi:MAG: hypothetical protein DI569_12830 [Sphingopyxis macrogoltabida]|uniref:Lipoprotein n=1 Tax=Sphingopyxis macrogoltabida TaxID=33050 RepID=A0A2W5KYR8_SPHMC|nr:MAG: hypothetical protein DI569_12830 [Sphingopyxis macrogoltabida]
MRQLVITAALAASLAGCSTEADRQIDQLCSGVTELAVTTFRGRSEGMTEDAAMALLRDQKVYSGIRVWAVKSAFEAPADMSEALFRGSVFGECVKRKGE